MTKGFYCSKLNNNNNNNNIKGTYNIMKNLSKSLLALLVSCSIFTTASAFITDQHYFDCPFEGMPSVETNTPHSKYNPTWDTFINSLIGFGQVEGELNRNKILALVTTRTLECHSHFFSPMDKYALRKTITRLDNAAKKVIDTDIKNLDNEKNLKQINDNSIAASMAIILDLGNRKA